MATILAFLLLMAVAVSVVFFDKLDEEEHQDWADPELEQEVEDGIIEEPRD